MKKRSLTGKLVIILVILAIVFLSLSIASAFYSIDRATSAINAIGTVEYTEESKVRIDEAEEAYQALDKNLGLQNKISNSDALSQAKQEYVRLAIKKMYLAIKQGEEKEEINTYISDARTAFDTYFTEADAHLISNYEDLTEAEANFANQDPALAGSSPDETSPAEEEEELELC